MGEPVCVPFLIFDPVRETDRLLPPESRESMEMVL